MPTMIALRRWGVRAIPRDELLDGIADFLLRGMGFAMEAPRGGTKAAGSRAAQPS